MPRPYSTDLRERALLACEADAFWPRAQASGPAPCDLPRAEAARLGAQAKTLRACERAETRSVCRGDLDGICAAMTITGATSSAVFLAFVTQVLVPALRSTRPDAAVVMDPRKSLRDFADPAAHKAAVVRRAFNQAGVSYRCLPAYSPDLRQTAPGHSRVNPIEHAWSKLKAKRMVPSCRLPAKLNRNRL